MKTTHQKHDEEEGAGWKAPSSVEDCSPKFIIQYTGNEPRPYAVALNATSVCGPGPGQNGIWNASDTREYAREINRYAIIVAPSRQIMNCQKWSGGLPPWGWMYF